MKRKIVALLPIKANSTRVPGKNFKDFCGKPLFQWILDSLLAVEEIDQIVINTDAKEILIKNGLIESEKVMIRQRKANICGDEVSMNTVLADDVENIEADVYLMTHTTNPLLSTDTIKRALAQYEAELLSGKADSLFTVNKIQTRFYTQSCQPINHDPNNLIPTQNLEPWYEENSNLYIFNRDSFASTKARIGMQPCMMVSPPMECSDIDTPDDWDKAVVMTHYMLDKGMLKL